ncbi:MAG TPA: lysophospholipid acyltransferase family protein [Steroidobacteraceae bacterium]|nr:lysophospholipid acyltransferase family protein [Steroidobacteraceae bacterium]
MAFAVLVSLLTLLAMLLPGLRRRRLAAGWFSRAFFKSAAIHFSVEGLERLPAAPCVLVANHASYIDGVVAIAALPPDFAFVIKREMRRVPLASLLLRRLGSAFVERFDRHKGGSDTRRVWRLAATGQSLVFFPEGTFDEQRRIRPFLPGAFVTAERSRMPVVAAAIHGTREVLPSGSARVRRHPIRFEVLGVVEAENARQQSRELIARALGEPLGEAPDP